MKVVMRLPMENGREREIFYHGIPVPPVGASVILDSNNRNRSYVVKNLAWFLADQTDDPGEDCVQVTLETVSSYTKRLNALKNHGVPVHPWAR
jgi:hypothetical protein